MISATRVWSLWEMLTLFVPWVTTSVHNLGLIAERLCQAGKDANSKGSGALVPVDTIKGAHIAVSVIAKTADDFALIASKAQTGRCVNKMKDSFTLLHDGTFMIGADDADILGNMLSNLSVTLTDELTKTVFVAARRGDDDLLSDDAQPFGLEVENAFPSSIYDISEAARCRALYRWTACVMHLMRVLEVGLAELAKFAHVLPGENWNTLLNQIEAELKKVAKKTHSAEDEQFAAEAATHFRSIKNAWRNHSMHAREKYDEERAIAIYESIRSFMRHLSTRLSE